MYFIRTAIRLIHLVDHHNWLQVQVQRLLQYETRLRHRPFKRIYQQQYAISHFQYTLHLTAKIGVTRSINYIYFYAFVCYRNVLSQDGDTTLTFQVVAVHDQVTSFLVVTKYIGGV